MHVSYSYMEVHVIYEVSMQPLHVWGVICYLCDVYCTVVLNKYSTCMCAGEVATANAITACSYGVWGVVCYCNQHGQWV